MTCGLGDEELFILNLLYKRRCLSRNKGFHSDKLAQLFQRKFNKNPKKIIKKLRNNGYLDGTGKSPEKYYIADKGKTFYALDQHGFSVTKGRKRPL